MFVCPGLIRFCSVLELQKQNGSRLHLEEIIFLQESLSLGHQNSQHAGDDFLLNISCAKTYTCQMPMWSCWVPMPLQVGFAGLYSSRVRRMGQWTLKKMQQPQKIVLVGKTYMLLAFLMCDRMLLVAGHQWSRLIYLEIIILVLSRNRNLCIMRPAIVLLLYYLKRANIYISPELRQVPFQ